MPFRVVSGVDREMGVLDGVEIAKGEGQFWAKTAPPLWRLTFGGK